MQRRQDDRVPSFSIPQVVLICGFVAALSGLAGWILNIEIRKADRSEIIGVAYRQALDARLDNIESDLRYIRRRVDDHVVSQQSLEGLFPKSNNKR